jgi:hypothetical protein
MKVLLGCPLKNVKVKSLTKEQEKQQGYTGRGRKKSLQQAAQARGIPTTKEYDDILEGWLGKPKVCSKFSGIIVS